MELSIIGIHTIELVIFGNVVQHMPGFFGLTGEGRNAFDDLLIVDENMG
jgi:hypothetical protein